MYGMKICMFLNSTVGPVVTYPGQGYFAHVFLVKLDVNATSYLLKTVIHKDSEIIRSWNSVRLTFAYSYEILFISIHPTHHVMVDECNESLLETRWMMNIPNKVRVGLYKINFKVGCNRYLHPQVYSVQRESKFYLNKFVALFSELASFSYIRSVVAKLQTATSSSQAGTTIRKIVL
jgi:hypothetical protein